MSNLWYNMSIFRGDKMNNKLGIYNYLIGKRTSLLDQRQIVADEIDSIINIDPDYNDDQLVTVSMRNGSILLPRDVAIRYNELLENDEQLAQGINQFNRIYGDELDRLDAIRNEGVERSSTEKTTAIDGEVVLFTNLTEYNNITLNMTDKIGKTMLADLEQERAELLANSEKYTVDEFTAEFSRIASTKAKYDTIINNPKYRQSADTYFDIVTSLVNNELKIENSIAPKAQEIKEDSVNESELSSNEETKEIKSDPIIEKQPEVKENKTITEPIIEQEDQTTVKTSNDFKQPETIKEIKKAPKTLSGKLGNAVGVISVLGVGAAIAYFVPYVALGIVATYIGLALGKKFKNKVTKNNLTEFAQGAGEIFGGIFKPISHDKKESIKEVKETVKATDILSNSEIKPFIVEENKKVEETATDILGGFADQSIVPAIVKEQQEYEKEQGYTQSATDILAKDNVDTNTDKGYTLTALNEKETSTIWNEYNSEKNIAGLGNTEIVVPTNMISKLSTVYENEIDTYAVNKAKLIGISFEDEITVFISRKHLKDVHDYYQINKENVDEFANSQKDSTLIIREADLDTKQELGDMFVSYVESQNGKIPEIIVKTNTKDINSNNIGNESKTI